MPVRSVSAAPRASALIESMRDIGYTLGSALADVIDNSITAGATVISMLADTAGDNPRFGIVDNGRGMTYAQLLNAMRPGASSPLAERKSDDLGRFGLGMKTASFSQCRRLTVVSRHTGNVSAARWDLDYVSKVDEWLVQIPEDPLGIPWADKLESDGTLILWEKLDRLVGGETTREGHAHLVGRIDEAIDHLELVFHRYLTGEKGTKRVAMSLNGRPLVAFDPFHSSHPATIAGPVERIRVKGEEVVVQAFTLPHHKKVAPDAWDKYAGRAGYTRNQGFYLYRGRRLIIFGTWFGLARQLELTKLARVRIDMPNDLDSDWKIDVRKSTASPPRRVRERLRRIIDAIGAGSKRVYTSRGTRLFRDSRVAAWQRLQDKNQIRYRVNHEHPAIAEYMARLGEPLRSDFLGLLELIGAALPIDALFADVGAQPEAVAGSEMSIEALTRAVAATYNHLVTSGLSSHDVLSMLRTTEPFRSFWADTERIVLSLQTTEKAND